MAGKRPHLGANPGLGERRPVGQLRGRERPGGTEASLGAVIGAAVRREVAALRVWESR